MSGLNSHTGPPARQRGEQPDSLIALMSSLADTTRLRLLRVLEHEELGVAELCAVLQLPQSTVSRHLKVLSQRGWLGSRQRGTANLYRMRGDELSPHARELWRLSRDQTSDWATLGQDRLRLQRLISRRRSASFFAQAVHEWEKLRNELYGAAFMHRAVAALLPADWAVVDLGCGVGELVGSLGDHVRRVVGVDQSAQMLGRARARVAEQANATVLQGELTAVPLASSSFDAALNILVLSYLPEPRAALSEMARLLRPGGRAVVVTLLRHDRETFRREMGQAWPGFGRDELCEMLRGAGLESATCRAAAPEPGAKGPALLLATASKS